MIDPELDGRIVLITGANHGIGAATARAFAAQGARVFLSFYIEPGPYSEEELRQAKRDQIGGSRLYAALKRSSGGAVADDIRASGGVAVAREADLSDAAAIPRLFDECEASLGPVDVLVCNHTHCVADTFDPTLVSAEGLGISPINLAGIDRHFAVNARACALLMAEYVRRYLVRGAVSGRIVNVSTDAAHAHVANTSYAASKHAMESYSRSAAAELGKYGISVNVVAPGPIQTGYLTPAQETAIAAGTPLGRVGKPEDVADVVVFLASEKARWLTGQLLYVGGGWRMPQ